MVEWKKLGEVCSLKARIGWQGLTQKEHKTTGEYLLVTGTDFTANYGVNFDHCVYVDEERYTQDPNIQLRQNDVLITKDGTLGKMAVIENLPKPATLNGGLFVIRDLTGKIHHKYLLHYMLSSKFQSIIDSNHTNGTIKHLTQALLTNFPIPIPTLEIQLEIVRILDTFTASIDNLKEQIAQRRKQYEYYRDQLLDLEGKPGVEMKTLPEISDNRDRVRKPITSSKRKAGNYPYYGASGIVDYVDGYIFNGDYLLISEDGANLVARSTPIAFSITGKNWVNNHAHVLQFQDKATQKYVEIYLNMIDLEPWINGAAQPKLNQDNLNKISIPLPSLQEQQRIVSILDTFEASIQNLEAQLSQREKQYDYYRNKLLTFE